MDPDRKSPPPPGSRPQPEGEETRPTDDRRPVARPLPHERDESPPDEGVTGPRQVTEQAARDVARGLRDTDRRGTPSDVPGPGPAPERSPGAEVPPDGVKRDE